MGSAKARIQIFEVTKTSLRTLPLAIILASLLTMPLQALARAFSDLPPNEQLSEDILRELIGFESTIERPDYENKSE
jgi:hypothetical protein